MKNLIIVFLLIFMGCKNDANIKPKVDKSVIKLWKNYLKANPEIKNKSLPESWYFHNNKKDANRLTELIVSKKKTVFSSLYFSYKKTNQSLPKKGTQHIITDFDGKAKVIIEINKVDTIPFNKISKKYAELDMGTNKEPLIKWKKAHWNFFKNKFKNSKQKPSQEMLIICQEFKIVWPK